MKQITEEVVLEHFGNAPEKPTEFRVKQSREMFKLLSSNIYSDKVSAVIRELSANAIDAHAMAGNSDTPIEVHLPNKFEPYFYVKDFGTGLSKEMILNLYSTYGESTKTEDNNQVGCFGIGSKSPFAYTDTFTITSRHNGVRYVFTCFISDDGIPAVAPVSESSTDEPNGLEVYMAVENKDFQEFKKKAEDIYEYYEVTPNVIGVPDFSVKANKPVKTYDLPCGATANVYSTENPLRIVQGACSYPLDIEALSDMLRRTFKLNIQWPFHRCGLVITVPLGTVNIAASRESLEYDKHTLETLEKIFAELVAVVERETLERVEKVSGNILDVADELAHIFESSSIFLNVCEKLQFNGKPLDDLYHTLITINCTEGVQDTDSKGNNFTWDRPLAEWCDISSREIRRSRGSRVYKNWKFSRRASALLSEKSSVIIVNEEDKNIPWRLLKYNADVLNDVYIEDLENPVLKDSNLFIVTPKKGRTNEVVQKIKDTLPEHKCWSLVYVKDLAKIPKSTRPKSKKKSVEIYKNKLTGNTGSYFNYSWEEAEHDPEDGGVYVNLSRGQWADSVDGIALHSIVNFIRYLKGKGKISEDFQLFGIPATHKKIVTNNDSWVSLHDFLKPFVKDLKKSKKLKKALGLKDAHRICCNQCYNTLDTKHENVSQWVKFVFEHTEEGKKVKSLVLAHNKEFELLEDELTSLQHIKSAFEFTGIKLPKDKTPKVDLPKVLKEFGDKFYLLKEKTNYWDLRSDANENKTTKAFLDYVKLLDQQPHVC